MKPFDAWCLPAGFIIPEREIVTLQEPPFPPIRHPIFSGTRVAELLALLRENQEGTLSTFSVDRVLSAVDGVARRLLDPLDELRGEALAEMGPQAGFSSTMSKAILDGMARDWTRDRLQHLLQSEFQDPLVLDGFRPGSEGGQVQARGYPLAFHLGSGTVPGVAVTSMVRSLLVKSAVLLKPGRGDVVLPRVFARGLAEEDPDLAGAVAVLYWPEDATLQTEEALSGADLVVAYGGNDTLAGLRDSTPFMTPLRAYRHRMGFCLVGRNALGEAASQTAHDAAGAVSMFDQRGCVSPQVIFVEEGGVLSPEEWASLLADHLQEWEEELPSGGMSPFEAVSLQQLRGVGELMEGTGEGRVLHGGKGASWTVLFQPGGGSEPTCLGRSVRVLPVKELGDALKALEPHRALLQTVGVAGLADREEEVVEGLARLGVSRITPLSKVPWPPPWWHHDGSGPLQDLVRWTDVEG